MAAIHRYHLAMLAWVVLGMSQAVAQSSASVCSAGEPDEASQRAIDASSYNIRYDSIDHPVVAREGMVVSQSELASQIGAEILRDGGNAVDSAVAVGFALAVTLPRAGNL